MAKICRMLYNRDYNQSIKNNHSKWTDRFGFKLSFFYRKVLRILQTILNQKILNYILIMQLDRK